jgi:hypothetical protein
MFTCPVRLGSAESGFVLTSPTQLREYDDGQLEGEALYASYPPLTADISKAPMSLAFSPRDDPAYHEGERGPTEDAMTDAVREARRRLAMGRNPDEGDDRPE